MTLFAAMNFIHINVCVCGGWGGGVWVGELNDIFMQKATLNQCCEVSLSVCYLQYSVLQYHMMLIMLQSVFDKTVTCTFTPFCKSLFVKELYSFRSLPISGLCMVWYNSSADW